MTIARILRFDGEASSQQEYFGTNHACSRYAAIRQARRVLNRQQIDESKSKYRTNVLRTAIMAQLQQGAAQVAMAGGARAVAAVRQMRRQQALTDAVRTVCRKGRAVPERVRMLVALAVNQGGMTVRAAALQYGISAASACRFAQCARQVRLPGGVGADARQARVAAVQVALHDRRRCRCTQHRVMRPHLLDVRTHGEFVRHQLTRVNDTLYLHELRTLLERRYPTLRPRIAADGRVLHVFSLPTLQRFVTACLGLVRKRRRACRVPAAGRTAVNLARRRAFVRCWFGASATQCLVGTHAEFGDQRRWRLVLDATSPAQLFFADETGVNWNTTARRYGRAARGHTCYAVREPPPRGPNHSVLLTMSAQCGAIAHQTLVAQRRGTRRVNFCAYLREHVGPAMEAAAAAAGVAPTAPLYLIIDNASIHRGAMVEAALREHCPRARLVYLPPYAPTMNPIELVNKDLKLALQQQRGRGGALVSDGSLRALIAHTVHTRLQAAAYAPTAAAHYAHCGWQR